MAATQSEIRYLTPPSVDVKKKKYCRFKKNGIKYIDYKDPYHWYFFEVPTSCSSSCEESSSFGVASFRNRFNEIILKRGDRICKLF